MWFSGVRSIFLLCLPLLFILKVHSFAPRCTDCKWTQHWELQSRLNISGVLPVYKYKSRRTGLTVVLAQSDSPIVNGYFCLATEAWTEEGLPHTLEHLIFLGSEDYPYKEVLDLLANRCLADRTNAWTDTDHTCYTVYTAGSGGFLNILPIYMDHILHPLLRKEDFMTEVHHINGDGDDAGVVYSEMQGVENKPSSIIYFDLIKQIYPGNSSYTSQTGGRLKAIRESTTIEKVRAYHQKYYRPENMYITITGNVDPNMLFAALDPVERKIIEKADDYSQLEKPFSSPLETIEKDAERTIQYPSEEEEFGRISMGWRIPGKLSDVYKEIHALSILGSYLSSTSISPLKKTFVDIAEPLATDVDIDILMNAETAVTVDFENVPINKMDSIEPLFKATLDSVHQEGLNMDRLETIIRRMVLTRKTNLENSPHLIIPDPAVLDMLYGSKPDELYNFIKEEEEENAEKLIAKPESFWLDLMNVTFSRPRVMTKAYPSQALDLQLVKEENERLEKQREILGPEGLEAKGKAIQEALDSQILPPPEVLKSVPIADVNSIQFRKLTFYNHTTEVQPKGFELQKIPFHFQLDDVNSQFVRFYAFLDTSDIPLEDKQYLVALTELWLVSPLKTINGSIEPYENVLQRRSKVVLSFYNDLGYKGSTFSPGSYSDLIMFFGEAEISNYEGLVNIFKEALFDIEYNLEKARSLISQALNGLPSMKLSLSSMNSALFDNLYFNEKSTIYHSSALRQQRFLTKLSEELRDNPGVLIAKLHELRKKILKPKNLFVHLSTSLERLKGQVDNPAQVWTNLFDADSTTEFKSDLTTSFPTKSEYLYVDNNPSLRHAIIGLPGSSSCYLKQSIPFDVQDWEAQDVATMRVMLQYLSDRMYDEIRGEGLVYGVSISSSVTEGRARVSFTRSSQLPEAYAKFREMIGSYTNTSITDEIWDQEFLESAKGSQIYNWAEKEETIEDLGSSSVKATLRRVQDPYYNRRFVKKLAKVSLKDVQLLAFKYLPLFEIEALTRTAITCGSSQVDSVTESFQQYGIDLKVIDDVDNSVMTE